MKEAFDLIKERLEETKKIDVCEEISCCDCDSRYGFKGCDTKQQYLMADKCMDIVSEVEAEYGNGWIDVKDRLPEEYCHCLVTRKKEYADGNFDMYVQDDVWIELEGCWGWQSEFEGWIENIIAWMPLPLPYKPEKGV